MSQLSVNDPSGQAIRAASGLSRYDRTGWRRWLVSAVAVVVVVAVAALATSLIVG